MFTLRQKVIAFALISRFSIIFLQAIANALIPDHSAQGVFVRPAISMRVTNIDRFIAVFLGGFERWDAQYFLHISEYGYVYENTVAFFPLFPILLWFTSGILKIFFLGVLNERSLLLLSSILVNTVCFVKTADVLFKLSLLVLKDQRVAYKASLLFCVNPASIFFSAPYSETVFALLSFSGMYSSLKEPFTNVCAVPFGLSAATRSNGILNFGFILFRDFKHFLLVKWPLLLKRESSLDIIVLPFRIIASLLSTFQACIVAVAPFVAFQLHCYQLFCTPVHLTLPDIIVDYGTKHKLVMPGIDDEHQIVDHWCNSTLPLAYSYVQHHYWDVGFLKYYKWKQLPNFLLAMPLLTLIIFMSFSFFKQHMDLLFCLGLKCKELNLRQMQRGNIMSPQMFVFVVHAVFLSVFCLLFVHIQVSTRMICSSSPVPYWYAAYILCKKEFQTSSNQSISKHIGMKRVKTQLEKINIHNDVNNDAREENAVTESTANMQSYWKVIIFTEIPTHIFPKLVLLYFVGYAIAGTVLFTNFLPWT